MKSFSILAGRAAWARGLMAGTSELAERFDRVRRQAPDRRLIYLPAAGAAWTADDLWSAHLQLRAALRRNGLGANDLVVSALANRPAAVPLLLACLSEQVILLPADAGTTRPELDDLLSRFQASAAILPRGGDGPAGVLGGVQIVRAPRAPSGTAPPRGVAMLKLTSGSSGPPKAVLTGESHLIHDAERISERMGIAASDTQIAVIPLSHSYGLGNLVLPLLLQGTAMVLRDAFLPQQVAADARLAGARVFPGVPFMFEHFASNPPAGGWPISLRLLISAGARLEGGTIGRFRDRFGQAIHSFYGSSETGGVAFDDECDDQAEPGCVGRPLRGVTIALRSQDGAPPGSGRVHVSSDAVARGYAGEDAGRGAFAGGGFLTGDFGRLDERGRLVLTGRLSSFINVAGRKVRPEEVERALLAMPGVADACVVAVPDPSRGQRIGACLVARHRITLVEIRRFCAARLAPHKIPRAVLVLERMPTTARGKIDRLRVEQMVRDSIAEGC